MNTEKSYMKVIEWSDEDGCFIGSAPPLIGQCCHGDTEEGVFRQLGIIVSEWIEEMKKEGQTPPEASAGKDYSGKFLVRVSPEIHRAATIRAMQARQSLNAFVESAIERLCLEPGNAKVRGRSSKNRAA